MADVKADIAVLGSGFGGSLSALVTERLGLRPVVIDKARHPRFAIGESSTPSANMILRRLAKRYDLPQLQLLSRYGTWQENYPHLVAGRKRGFSYFHHRPGQSFQPDSRHRNELLVAASSEDYHSDTHWLRADIDAFLAREVRAADIPFFEGTTLTSLKWKNGRWRLVGMKGSKQIIVEARFIIDGTGGGGMLLEALDLPTRRPKVQLRSRALFSHFKGVKPWQQIRSGGEPERIEDHPFPCDRAAVHHVLEEGWMWQFRFDNGRVSAGLVLDDSRCRPLPAMSPAQEWSERLSQYPTLQKQFEGAQIADSPGRIVRTGLLQRRMARVADAHWALLPHTAGFVDPLHSTGIAHTLSGIERLAHILDEHWNRPTLLEALQTYEQHLLRELAFIDRLIALCYRSLSSFRLWTTATMFYFAAATTYERRRAVHQEKYPQQSFPGLFLCAGESGLYQTVSEALQRLSALPEEPEREQVKAFERFAADGLEPYNEVGLFDPPANNMYPYTAAPVL